MAATFAEQYANEQFQSMNANESNTVPSEAANMAANAYAETGDALRVRLGVQPRTFQKVWKRTFGYPFDSRRIVTGAELEAMEAKYLVKQEVKPERKRVERKPKAKMQPVTDDSKAIVLNRISNDILTIYRLQKEKEEIAQKAARETDFGKIVRGYIDTERLAAWAMFLIPTIASIRNTVSVSGAFSGSHETALLITATISGTGILWIMSRKKVGWGDMAGIFVFQLFEAFSNMVQVFKTLMGSMAYGLTTVSGKPSELLDMVATTTQSDHRDTALLLAGGVAIFILAAQVKGLLLIKAMKQ